MQADKTQTQSRGTERGPAVGSVTTKTISFAVREIKAPITSHRCWLRYLTSLNLIISVSECPPQYLPQLPMPIVVDV